MKASDFEIHNYKKLDKILSKLCALVVEGQKTKPKYYGKVAAAVLDPNNNLVARLNYPTANGRVHAERAAMEAYEEQYGDIPKGSIVITTLSPCSEDMSERDGPSCTDYINNSSIKKVYCGYQDPTQDEEQRRFTILESNDFEIRDLCKTFADTFIHGVNEAKRRKKKIKKAAYGPGPFGMYGTDAGYSGDVGVAEGDLIPWPKGTVKVDVDDVYDWYKLGMNISDLDDANPKDFGKGPPQTVLAFGSEPEEHRYLKNLKRLGMPTHDIDENFADGRNPQDKGDAKRHGINTKASVSSLRKTAKQGGRKGQLAHWLANMKAGRAKKK